MHADEMQINKWITSRTTVICSSCTWCFVVSWVIVCVRCSYEAVQLSHLRRHLETHDVQKRFACSHCDYSANTVSYLKIHQSRQHPADTSATSIITQRHDADSSLQCHVCHYRFGNTSDLKRHSRLRHGVDPTVISTASVCEWQGLIFRPEQCTGKNFVDQIFAPVKMWTIVRSVRFDLKELGGIRCWNVWNFAKVLKFKANFHSKMSVCRHELGWGFNPSTIFTLIVLACLH